MILCLRVANLTSRPHSALGGMMYFDTSSKLNKNLLDDSARFRGDGTSGRGSSRASGDESTELDPREFAESSGHKGTDETLEEVVAMSPSGTCATILGP